MPGDSREAADLCEAVTGYDELLKTAGRAVSATAKQRLQKQLDALDAQIAELESAPAREARWEYRPTGGTYRTVWEESDTDARRDLLHRSGIKDRREYQRCGGKRPRAIPDRSSSRSGYPPRSVRTLVSSGIEQLDRRVMT